MQLLRALEAVHSSRDVKGQQMLACQLWLQIYVSIVNRPARAGIMSFPAIHFELYGITITYDILLILPRLFDKLKSYILSKLCKQCMLDDLVKIHDQFEWPIYLRDSASAAFGYACGKGHLDVAKWLYTTFQLTVEDVRSANNFAFISACEYGQLDVAKWLYKTFPLTVDDVRWHNNYAFRWTCADGHLDMAQWLYSTFQLTAANDTLSYVNDAFRSARVRGHQNVCDWLIATFKMYPPG